jgi:hypothetical protein
MSGNQHPAAQLWGDGRHEQLLPGNRLRWMERSAVTSMSNSMAFVAISLLLGLRVRGLAS